MTYAARPQLATCDNTFLGRQHERCRQDVGTMTVHVEQTTFTLNFLATPSGHYSQLAKATMRLRNFKLINTRLLVVVWASKQRIIISTIL